MILLLLSSTLLLGSALTLCALLPRQAHAARGRLLLGAMAGGLLLPLGPWLTPGFAWSATTSHHLMGWTRAEGAPGLAALLFGAWFIGAAWLGLRFLRAAHSLYSLRSHAQAMNRQERKALRRALPALPRRLAARIQLSPDLAAPCVVPFGRGRILLPANHRTWDRATLACVVSHELEHMRRGDVWWALLSEALRIVWWFHPLAHRVARDWSLQCEHLCDAAALRDGASPELYARALLSLASGARAATGALSFASDQPSRLRRRVERVLQTTPAGAAECGYLGWIALAILVIMGVAAFALCSARQAETLHENLLQADTHLRLEANPFPAGE